MLDQRLKNEPAETPAAIVQRLNLAKTTGDDSAVTAAIEEAITENPKALEDYRAGKAGALNFLVGQVMKKTRGKADPATPEPDAHRSTQEEGGITRAPDRCGKEHLGPAHCGDPGRGKEDSPSIRMPVSRPTPSGT